MYRRAERLSNEVFAASGRCGTLSLVTSIVGHTVVFGGSFNPPHVGHQMACLYLLEALAAEAVWIVPTFMHAFDKPLLEYGHRAAMCELLAAPFKGRVVVSDAEARRGGPSRTYDTLVQFAREHPERRFALNVGADILRDTDKWYRWPDIEALVPIVVLGRAGYKDPRAWPVDLPAVSSTEIRERVRVGLSIEGLVPSTVARYVAEHRLYV